MPLPEEISARTAARSLGSLLADAAPGNGLRVGSLGIQAWADPEQVTVNCFADAT
jgi:hypothetical protein